MPYPSITRVRKVTVVAVLTLLTLLLGALLGTARASANNYSATLNNGGGWTSAPTKSGTKAWNRGLQLTTAFSSTGASTTGISSTSWSAPSGTEFLGFTYTGAAFAGEASDSPSTGGLAGGIIGVGSNKNEVLFPWTDDCQIVNSNHDWVGWAVSGDKTRPTGLAQKGISCTTGGNTSGWTYENYEYNIYAQRIDNTPVDKLELLINCDSTGKCQSGARAEAAIDNLTAEIKDPQDTPALSSPLTFSNPSTSSSAWYQTIANGPVLNIPTSDESGVCYLNVAYTGTDGGASGSSGDLIATPATVTPSSKIGRVFSSYSKPCGTNASATTQYRLPSTLASGSYNFTVNAENAGQYAGAGYSGSGAKALNSTSPKINVDNVHPEVSPAGEGTFAAVLQVTAGPSGIASMACTDNGANVGAALTSGSATGAGVSDWTIPLTTPGASSVHCVATNGDANVALSTTFDYGYSVSSTGVVTPTGSILSWVAGLQASISAGLRCKRTHKVLRCSEIDLTAANGTLTLPFGRRTRVTGRLTVQGGGPAFNTKVQFWSQVNGRSKSVEVGQATTDANGHFVGFVDAGPSRTLIVEAGQQALVFHEHTRGAISIALRGQAQAGHKFYVTGRVLGGFIPSGGVIVSVQDSYGSGWYTARDANTTGSGTFKVSIPLTAANAGRRYYFRIKVLTQSGWPFRGTISPVRSAYVS